MVGAGFKDHFSGAAIAGDYAQARPGYPGALFDWIAAIAPATGLCWEAGCGSGQATRALAGRFARVHATDPSAVQVAHAPAIANVTFVVEPGERCSLPDGVADAACVAQALHWFDRAAYFAECARVLAPGGVLVAWGYRDIEVPAQLDAPMAAFRDAIAGDWPPERADVDAGYAGYDWPFDAVPVPALPPMAVDWQLARLLGYFGSFSAVAAHRRRTGEDPVAQHADAFAAAWGDPAQPLRFEWPQFVHARRRSVPWRRAGAAGPRC